MLSEYHKILVSKLSIHTIILGIIIGCFGIAQPQGIVLSTSFGLTILGGLAIANASNIKHISISNLTICALLLIYVFYLIFNIINSEINYYSMTSFAFYAAIPVLGLLLSLNPKFLIKNGQVIITQLVWSFTPFAIWAVIQFFYFPTIFSHQASHPLTNSNILGGLFNVMALLSLSLFFTQHIKSWRYFLYGSAFLLFGLAILATGSRGALLAILSSFVVFFTLMIPTKRLRLMPTFIFGAILYCAFLIFNRFASGQISSLYHSALHGRSYNERWIIWQQAIDMIHDAPFFGFGIGTYSAILPSYRSIGDQSSGLNAHSDYLHMGTEIGLIGLCLYFSIILYTVFLVVRHIFKIIGSKDQQQKQQHNQQYIFLIGSICAVIAFLLQGIVSSVSLTLPFVLITSLLSAYIWACLTADNRTVYLPPTLSKLIKTSIMSLAIISCLIYTSSHFSTYTINLASKELKNQNIEAFDGYIKLANTLSFSQNPNVYLMSSELPYAMLLSDQYGLMPNEQKNDIIKRLAALYEASLSLNPHNPLVYFKKGNIALHLGNELAAENLWEKSILIDPIFLEARIALSKAKRKKGEINEYEAIMLAGAHWSYCRQNPKQYYLELMNFDKKILKQNDISASLLQEKKNEMENRRVRHQKMLTLHPF